MSDNLDDTFRKAQEQAERAKAGNFFAQRRPADRAQSYQAFRRYIQSRPGYGFLLEQKKSRVASLLRPKPGSPADGAIARLFYAIYDQADMFSKQDRDAITKELEDAKRDFRLLLSGKPYDLKPKGMEDFFERFHTDARHVLKAPEGYYVGEVEKPPTQRVRAEKGRLKGKFMKRVEPPLGFGLPEAYGHATRYFRAEYKALIKTMDRCREFERGAAAEFEYDIGRRVEDGFLSYDITPGFAHAIAHQDIHAAYQDYVGLKPFMSRPNDASLSQMRELPPMVLKSGRHMPLPALDTLKSASSLAYIKAGNLPATKVQLKNQCVLQKAAGVLMLQYQCQTAKYAALEILMNTRSSKGDALDEGMKTQLRLAFQEAMHHFSGFARELRRKGVLEWSQLDKLNKNDQCLIEIFNNYIDQKAGHDQGAGRKMGL